MNRDQIITEIAKEAELTKGAAGEFLDVFCEVVTNAVASGDSVKIQGFGIFEPKQRAARIGRNPKTGEEIPISATVVPVFKAGKQFKDIVAEG